jgi:peptide subunit release factor 1 (eRF1)
MEERTKLRYELKKQLAHLRQMKGSGTELISVYIPSGQAIHETSNKLRGEAGQASNIKSKSTRKNVTDALERILHHLKSYGNTAPKSGVAIFCGNVSDNPAKVDIEIFTIFPPDPISVQIYRCDSRFFLEPLERTLEVTDSYGLVVLDGRECTLAELRGTSVRILHRLNSTAHAKIRKGGQCLAPDTMVQLADGTLAEVARITAGSQLKGADLSEFSIGDYPCSDRFETRSGNAYKIVAHAPKMEIVATAWHRFFTIGEGGVRETYAKDLKKGDRVLVAKRVRHKGSEVPVDGREVFAFAKSLGLSTSGFHAASNFFRGKKPLGREAFRKNIEGVLLTRARKLGKGGLAMKMLAKWLSADIGAARVAEKIPIRGEREYVDLTVPNAFNFVANGFIVHNSARRYERLIEESIELYYKRVGEAMDRYFVNTVKGVIIGGPGPTKDNFAKMSPFNYQIKVLGVVDTGYTDEYGVREVMAKSADILAEQQAVRERAVIERFIKEVVAGGLAAYGEKEVRSALESKQASQLLISEGVAYKRAKLVDTTTGEVQYATTRSPFELVEKIRAIGGTVKVESEIPLVDDLIALADRQGIDIFVVSPDTAEGAQFLGSFYGIGAFLRYR